MYRYTNASTNFVDLFDYKHICYVVLDINYKQVEGALTKINANSTPFEPIYAIYNFPIGISTLIKGRMIDSMK